MLETYGMYHWSQWTHKVQGYTGNPRYVSLEPVNVQGTGIYWKPTVCITGASEHTGYRDILEYPRYVSLEPVNIQGTGIYWKPTVCIAGASEHTGTCWKSTVCITGASEHTVGSKASVCT